MLKKNIPNILTYIRFALIPIFVALMASPSRANVFIATLVFLLASITDYFDGFFARKFGVTTQLGKILDPIADKLLVATALIMLVAERDALFADPWVPPWLVVIVIAREIWVSSLRSIATEKGVIVDVSSAGKIKTAVQLIAIVSLLLHTRFSFFGYELSFEWIGLNLLIISIGFSLWSAIDYTSQVWKHIRE